MRTVLGTLYDVEEAAEYLHVLPVTVRRWAREGRLPARRAGTRIRFTEEDLQAFLRPVVGEPWRRSSTRNQVEAKE
jgi:excisionase family DNA binding protein